MAQRGEASKAHEYDERMCCVHCGMYKVNVDQLTHVCKPWRELEVDQKLAAETGLDLTTYRTNGR